MGQEIGKIKKKKKKKFFANIWEVACGVINHNEIEVVSRNSEDKNKNKCISTSEARRKGVIVWEAFLAAGIGKLLHCEN